MKDKKIEVALTANIKKYKLFVTGKESEGWHYIKALRKSLRKHGQYLLLRRLELVLARAENIARAKEILEQHFVLTMKKKGV